MKIYLVGPISGESYGDVVASIEERRSALLDQVDGVEIYHPMTGKGHLRTETKFKSTGYAGSPVSSNRAIFGRDKWMVSQADVIVADFSSATIASIGSMFELAWAHLQGKLVVVIMGEDNVHQHAFVLQAADVIFEDFEEVVEYLQKIQEGSY